MRSLVIEDEPQIGAYLGRLLGQLRGIVDIVGSLSDAKQALGNFKYDLAILDRMLPDGDALDIVLALNKLPKRPAFIMLALLRSHRLGCRPRRPNNNAVPRCHQIRTGVGGPIVSSMDENAGTKASPCFRNHYWNGLSRHQHNQIPMENL